MGTGSYGKVYRGRWMARDVAVKVLEHSSLAAQRVVQECELIMGLTHPNVVRAFHYITWRKDHAGSKHSGSGSAPSANTSSSAARAPRAQWGYSGSQVCWKRGRGKRYD